MAIISGRDSKNALNQLLHHHNPFAENVHHNYTRFFFKSQWQNQINHLKQVSDEDTEQQKRLKNLIKKEEALRMLAQVEQTPILLSIRCIADICHYLQ